jgi:hypothetical protein
MISGYIIGDKEVVARLKAMPDRVKADIDAKVRELGFALQRRVQQGYLRGPRPEHLGVVSGTLLRSITQGDANSRSRFESTPATAFAYVGTNVKYAAGWEYGFERRVGAGARGGPRTLMGRALERYIAKHPPGVKQVAARPFLAPALEGMRTLIVGELESLLQRSLARATK